MKTDVLTPPDTKWERRVFMTQEQREDAILAEFSIIDLVQSILGSNFTYGRIFPQKRPIRGSV